MLREGIVKVRWKGLRWRSVGTFVLYFRNYFQNTHLKFKNFTIVELV